MSESIETALVPTSDGNSPQGLILAGGRSRRMGEDKGLIDYHGRAQVQWLSELLIEFCTRVRVSIGPHQQGLSHYRSTHTVVEPEPGWGPAGGLASAWDVDPKAAWLLVAVDLPLLDRATLRTLTSGRSMAHLATAFRHGDGTLEPLCTIWEPAARTMLGRRLERGDASLRRLLETSPVRVLEPPNAEALRSVDSPAERNGIRRLLRDM